MNICIVYPPKANGVSLYRLEIPHQKLDELYGKHYTFFSTSAINEMTEDELSIIDLFIFNRTWISVLKGVEITANVLRKYGAKIILDMDDHWELEKGHAFYEEYQKTNMTDVIKEHIKYADACIASTKYLAEEVLLHNSDVTIIENCPSDFYEQFKQNPTQSSVLRFGYFGAGQHWEDVQTMEHSMVQLAFDNFLNKKYKFYLAGFHEHNLMSHKYENIFSAYGENKNYGRIQAVDVYSYMQGYNYIDVSTAPLKNTKFNTFKSELKIMEAGYMGKTIIASKIPMYVDCIEHGVDGFLVNENRKSDWYKYMRELILNPNMAKEMAQKLEIKVRERFDINKCTERRHNLYQRLKK